MCNAVVLVTALFCQACAVQPMTVSNKGLLEQKPPMSKGLLEKPLMRLEKKIVQVHDDSTSSIADDEASHGKVQVAELKQKTMEQPAGSINTTDFTNQSTASMSARPLPPKRTSLAEWAAIAGATALVCAVVVGLYWRKGVWTVIKILCYLLALTTMKGAVRMIEKDNSFPYPLFLTATHFKFCLWVACAILLSKAVSNREKLAPPTLHVFTHRFAPIAFCFGSSVALGNLALVHSTTAFVEIVGATGPLVCLGMMLVMRQPIDLMLLGPCVLVCIGCALTSNGEPKFSWLGLLFAFGSNIPRSMKTILNQMLLSSDAAVYSPLESLAWTCMPSTIIMLTWSLMQEGVAPYHEWYAKGLFSNLTLAVLISCVNACVLNLAVLYVVKELGAVGAAIVAQSKSILVVLGGVCFLHEQVSAVEGIGFALVLTGVYFYNDVDSKNKAKKKAEHQKADQAPIVEPSK